MMTPKQSRKILLAVLFFLAGATVSSGLHRRAPEGDYGRLFRKQLPAAPRTVVTRTIPVVTEGTAVAVQPESTLVEPTATETPVVTPVTNAPAPVPGDGLAIVGGTDGVTLVHRNGEAERPHLSGGIFRQQ